jgi:O-succinylbenzoic acid--CoA ligase
VAGTRAVSLPSGPFTPEAFAAATRVLVESTDAGVPLYASLVPTQLRRLSASGEANRALESLTAILVGGSALGDVSVPTNVIETYGATETCGGCVYNGIPLDGVDVQVGDDDRIQVAGSTLADGYQDGDDSRFVARDGRRWFTTDDLGALTDGRLTVTGRADNVIVTGGYKVHPSMVERALIALDGVSEAVVVGLPDPEWGQRLVGLVVSPIGVLSPSTDEVHAALSRTIPRFAVPKEVYQVDRLPVLDSGKVDRGAAKLLANSEHEERGQTV